MEATEGKTEKSMRIKNLLLAFGLSLIVGKLFAVSFKVDGISYVANADTAIIKGYSEIPENGELTLASTVSYGGKDYRVTTIQQSAFLSCTDIKKLIVPASINYIQDGAFENCVNMTKLVLVEGTDMLDAKSDAFKNCEIEEVEIGRNLKETIFSKNRFLRKVIFDANIKEIPPSAFLDCSNLNSVDLSNIKKIYSFAFSGCSSLDTVDLSKIVFIGKAAFSQTKLNSVEIPSQLNDLGDYAFAYCQSLKNVSVKAPIVSIPNYCFTNCTSLASVEYPVSVTSIGEGAFSGCAFTSFKLNDGVTEIQKGAFCHCTNLENVDWGKVVLIGNNAFEDTGFSTLILPASLEKIYMEAFKSCKKMEKVDLSATKLTTIACFENCHALKTVVFPQTLTVIGLKCFDGCSSIEEIELPSSITTLSRRSFANMSRLKELDLSNTQVKWIGSECFEDCSSIQRVVMPKTLKSIGNSAFENASMLKTIDLSNTQVHYMSNECFKGCKALEEVSLAALTDTIGYAAFKNCEMLSNIRNSNSIKIVYADAFEHTKLFEAVQEGPAIIGTVLYQYKGMIADKEYCVPDNVTCIVANALAQQNFQSIKLNGSLKYIGDGAFDNCINLLSLTIPSSVVYMGSCIGCNALSSLTLKDAEGDLYLGELSNNKIKKFYMGRNITTQLDWLPDLESLTIGKCVKTIGSDFSSSEKLVNLELEDADATLDFENNPIVGRISNLYLGRNVKVGTYQGKDEYTYWDQQVTKGNSFLSLTDLTIGEKVTDICDYFCENNKVLEDLYVPGNVKKIGAKSFYRNVKLKSIKFEKGLETIGKLAFGYNDDPFNMGYSPVDKAEVIKEISIPSSVKLIDECAFAGVKVEKLHLSEGVGYLGNKCFMYIETDSIVLPSTVTLGEWNTFAFSSIRYVDASKYSGKLNSAFTFNGKMTKVLLNDDLKSLNCDFNYCNSLTSITLPNKLEEISTCEFTGVPINTLYIPSSVTNIGCEILASDSNYGNAAFVPSVIIEGNENSPKVYMNDSFCWSGKTRDSERKLRTLGVFKDAEYVFKSENEETTDIGVDSLILGGIREFTIKSSCGKRVLPTTAICLSPYLTSCDMWKPAIGKIYVLPGSKLPAEDIYFMYTVNKLSYEQPVEGNVLFDGINNMPYEITPVFYQDGEEVELKEAGVYDLNMKISGTFFDGIYPTGLKVTVTSSTGINNVTIDGNGKQCPIYNMNGQRVDVGYKGVVIQNGKKRIAK